MQTYKTYLKIPFVLVVARSTSKGIFVFKITMEKKCTKCKEVKDFDEFPNFKKGKHGKAYQCKSCFKDYFKKYKQDNKEKIKEYNKEYKQDNKEKIKDYFKKYKQDNKEKIKEYNKEYYSKNKDRLIKETSLYSKEKRENDSLYKLRSIISHRIRQSIKTKGYTKKTKTYNILKCEYDFFIEFLNGVASNGYTYGVGNLHLDHVVPISLAETEEEILLLCHYSNYQLLNATENVSKGNRYVNPLNLARVLEHHPNPDKIREIHARF